MMEELSYHILDLVQNSIRAKATEVEVEIEDSEKKDELIIKVKDNGIGMDKETLRRVTDPFYTTKKEKKVGLGVSLLKETALLCDGKFSIKSQPKKGTTVLAKFKRSHIDLPTIGNLEDTILSIISSSQTFDIVFKIKTDKGEFILDSKDIKKELGDEIPLCSPEVISFLREYINSGIKRIF